MLYQILPKKSYQFSSDKTLLLFKSLAAPNKRKKGFLKSVFSSAFDYQFIIDCDKEDMISFYFKTTMEDNRILNVLKEWVGSEADVFAVEDKLSAYEVIDTLYAPDNTKEEEESKNKLALFSNEMIFMNIISHLQKYTRVTIDFRVQQVSTKQQTSYFSKTSDVQLEILLRVHGHTKYSRNHVKEIAQTISNLTADGRMLRIDYKDSWKTFYASGMEILNMMQIPTLYRKEDLKLFKRIQYLRPGQKTLELAEFSKGIRIGDLYHPMQKNREIKVSEMILRTHFMVTGTTGSGKTSAIEEMIRYILLRKVKGEKNVPGFTFFDPAESSVLGVLDMILKFKSDGYDIEPLLEKVIYVDFNDHDYVFPIALLNKNVEPNELTAFFNSLFPETNGIQVERTVNSAISALMLDDKEHSVFDIERIFNEESFRQKIANKLKNNIYAGREIEFLNSKFNPNMVAPVLNRLDPFANTQQKRLMFGMTSKYDNIKNIRKWMDEGYIVLFNIKGMKEFDIKTIVGYYTLQCYKTALKRPDFSLMHMLIVDESHNVQLPIFAKVVAELRKPGLALGLMTQQMEQYNVDFLKKLIGNINTIISFRQNGNMAARNVLSFITDRVDINDFKVLPDMVGFLSTFDSYDKQKKSVLTKVQPPYRYTNGKLVDYEDTEEVTYNTNKNRKFAKEVMKKHLMTKEEAERIVFKKELNKKAATDYEDQLLESGDSLLSVEESEKVSKIVWEDSM